jgi:hypothetical protein
MIDMRKKQQDIIFSLILARPPLADKLRGLLPHYLSNQNLTCGISAKESVRIPYPAVYD